MNVSKKSWHYRLNTFLNNEYKVEEKDTLCSYFWYTVWNILWCVILAVGATAGMYILGRGFAADFGYPMWTSVFLGAVFFAVIFACTAGLLCSAYYSIKGVKSLLGKATGGKESLFVSYLKAKKRKICPMIDFK